MNLNYEKKDVPHDDDFIDCQIRKEIIENDQITQQEIFCKGFTNDGYNCVYRNYLQNEAGVILVICQHMPVISG